MTKEEIQKIEDKICDLFNDYRSKTIFDSTGRLGYEEWGVLVEYCKENVEVFKIFAKEALENRVRLVLLFRSYVMLYFLRLVKTSRF